MLPPGLLQMKSRIVTFAVKCHFAEKLKVFTDNEINIILPLSKYINVFQKTFFQK